MAAYAALLSLMHTLQHIKNHPRPPISLLKKQVDSLTRNLTFLQNFLECYSNSCSEEEEEVLERRIACVTYAAEDLIESHIVNQIHARSTSHCKKKSYVDLNQGLNRVIQNMNSIKKEVMEIVKEMMGSQHHQLNNMNPSDSIGPLRPVSRMQNNTMVDFGDILIEVLNKLKGQDHSLQIIPIVGMGGIGKTTLARNIYANPLIVEHFDILAWATISQEYSGPKILSQILSTENKGGDNMSDDLELGERVHKKLYGRRYLIVLDDIWSIEAWYRVKLSFPDNNNGSRIMITTRLTNLAFDLSGALDFQMNLLNEDKSWNLLCEIVFGKEDCPIEFEGIGKEIARKCRGLPLSIVVIGGLLIKSKMIREYWEHTLENLNSIINLENNEQCLEILRTSYKELPVHLKPCFLYLGVFPEDEEIRVSELTKLWVSEGFLKPSGDRSLEEIAKEYVKELIDRNLILVHGLRWNGKEKSCKIHDLLRDLCLREAKKQRLLCVLRSQDLNIPQGVNMERRVCIHENTEEEYSTLFRHAVESMSLTRSLLLTVGGSNEPSQSLSSRLLRVYSRVDKNLKYGKENFTSVEGIFQQPNLRYISIVFPHFRPYKFPSSWPLFWNLQTLKINTYYSKKPLIAPSEIWDMPLLRHVMVYIEIFELPDPPHTKGGIVLKNLQTLSGISKFKCSDEVVKRIPNIKTLKLEYDTDPLSYDPDGFNNLHLNCFVQLQKLESLRLHLTFPIPSQFRTWMVQSLNFPCSLKKLSLDCTQLYWEELTTKVGLLPGLEVLKLGEHSCTGSEWETVEGRFCSLKFLHILACRDLKKWKTDSTHFPRLERLVLELMDSLEEIPSCVGDIPTLQSIKLIYCPRSVEDSVERIKEEQEDYGNEDIQVDNVYYTDTDCYNSVSDGYYSD